MIDTIVLESPSLSEAVASNIEKLSIVRFGIDCEQNETLYTFTNKELKGSFDASIRIQVKREKYISIRYPEFKKNITEKVVCKPYLIVECSLHKFFLGHNIYGGSNNIKYQVDKLITFLEKELNINLPYYNTWKVRRIDYAKVYDLGENIESFFRGFSNVYYPRRRVQKYDTSGIYFPGTYTTLKLYDKGKEFLKHDRKRLLHHMCIKKVNMLKNIAEGKLRIELEVKSRKLKDMYGDLPYVNDIDIIDIENQFNVELKRVFKLGADKMKLYNNSEDVEKILNKNYGSSSGTLLGTWYKLSIFGYDYVKDTMPKSTFYRHVNKLRDVGISWNHTDITKKENNIIEFVFNPFNTDLEIKDDLIYKIAN